MKIERVQSSDSPFARLIETLYLEAFPANERKPIETLYSHQASGHADVFVILEEDERFVGMITTLKHARLMFVEYFAIAPEFRSLGYGSKVLTLLKAKYPDINICLEIEVVDPQAPDYTDRLRRLQFYEKNDFAPIGLRVSLFGVHFEVLGTSRDITFEEYFKLYEQIHGESFSEKLYQI